MTAVEAAHRPVEVLAVNAGIPSDKLLLRMSKEDFTSVLDTNLTRAFRAVKRASKGMMKMRRGRVIFVSSVSVFYGAAGQINYSASKAGMIGMARSLTREPGFRGITTNVIMPGVVKTDMFNEVSDEMQAHYLAGIPAGRFADPEEIAKGSTGWPAKRQPTSQALSSPSTAAAAWGTDRPGLANSRRPQARALG